MSTRLLSLLSDIEHAMRACDSSPDGGSWDMLRLVNFRQGLARLTLSIRSPERVTRSTGTILLQGFTLADGSFCLKANLAWQNTENSMVYAVYSKPGTNWRLEAGQIADKWLEGWQAQKEATATGTTGQAPASGRGAALVATG